MADRLIDPEYYRTTAEWGANPRLTGARRLMVTPILGVFLHHSVTWMTDENDANPTDDADDDMRRIESARPDLGGFPYSWGAHPSGIIAEGNTFHVGAHTAGYNSRYVGIVGIGNFETLIVPKLMQENISRQIAQLVLDGKMIRGFTLMGHQQVKATACPGSNLLPLIPAIKARTIQLINNPGLGHPEPPKQKGLHMARAYRFPDGNVWLCTGTHREHINEKDLNGRAWMGLIEEVPKNDPNKDDRFPQWVRKTNSQGAAILADLKVV